MDASNSPHFFVGIGGSGMMPLAMILRARGVAVAGSDRGLDQGRLSAKFDALRAAGIALHPQDGSGIVSRGQVVVASAAVEETVPDIAAADALGCIRRTRAETLAALFNAATLPIGVAGTSGKSTVTGMIAWILHATGRDPTAMNGAVMKNFVSADAPFASALVGQGEAFVSEVDESDGSIALYRPGIAVLNNVSLDHKGLDELRRLFGDFARAARQVVANIGDPETAALLTGLPKVTTFAIEGEADLVAARLEPEPFAIGFDLLNGRSPPFPSPGGDGPLPSPDRERERREAAMGEAGTRVRLQVPGRHNVSNALAAIAACVAAGVPLAQAARAIEGFTGLRRRFELVGTTNGIAVIDDFGHNPDKIAATLDTLHAHAGRLLILFQPHGYGPLKQMGGELIRTFVAKLASGDVLVMPDPVYHGGTVARDVGSDAIVAGVRAGGRSAFHHPDRTDAAARLVALARPGDRIVVMGARDDTLSALARDMLKHLRT